MTPSIDQTLHQFANLLPNWTLLTILTLLPNFGGFHRTLQRVRLANRGRLLLRTPGPVPFWTCICSYVETILSWTCHVYGPFEFRTSLGTSILPYTHGIKSQCLTFKTTVLWTWHMQFYCIIYIYATSHRVHMSRQNSTSTSLVYHNIYKTKEANTPYFRTQVQFNLYLSCKWFLSRDTLKCNVHF